MTDDTDTKTTHEDPRVLRSLLHVGVNLTAIEDVPTMLDMILQEIRSLSQAEAGTLYILKGGTLHLATVQNDRIPIKQLAELMADKELPVSNDSLPGFVASTRKEMNIPNSYTLPPGTPFRINREFDAGTGYRARSIFAIPLCCPDGKCIGVLELLNHLDDNHQVGPFPEGLHEAILSLASMAAVTIYNALLKDQLKKASLDTIIRLSVAAEFRDNETAEHIRRLSHTSTLIARSMGLSHQQVEVIRFASPMHDVGKIGIPDAILHKPGRLDDEERRVMQQHPLIATEILGDPLNDLVDAARAVALTHHEHWNGQGYPNGLQGEGIPLIGRIVGLADVFDALVSKRCYKEAYSLNKALDIVRQEEGKQFDPKVVQGFFQVLDEVLEFYNDPANRDPADRNAKALALE